MELINVFLSFRLVSGDTVGAYIYNVVVAVKNDDNKITHRLFTVKFRPKDTRFFMSNLDIDLKNARKTRNETYRLTDNPLPEDLQMIVNWTILEYFKVFDTLQLCKSRATGQEKPNNRYKMDIMGQFFFEELDPIGTGDQWELYQLKVGRDNVRKIYADGKFLKAA
jgi:hypothetical protein